jgi:HAD superfamily hydrolase (TIGR01549 family)
LAQKKIKAVLFDLGETLVNFGKVNTTRLFLQSARHTYQFLKDNGQPVGNFRPYCFRNLFHLRLRYLWSNITGKDFDALELLKKVNARYIVQLTEQQWQQLAWLWYEPLSNISEVEPKLKETLSALKKLGLKLGIITNTFVPGKSLEKHLNQLGIADFFPVKLYSYKFSFRKPDPRKFSFRKPDPRIFKEAAERIDEMIENIAFVGDRVNKDIKGASKIGMQPVLKQAYTNIGKKIPEGVWIIRNLCDLPALIEKNNAADI